MAAVIGDRVKETWTGTGTGTMNLAGAATGFRTFVAGCGAGTGRFYAIENPGTAEWEVGYGTVTAGSPDTLSRATVLASSNAGALTSFTAGTKNVFSDIPAALMLATLASGISLIRLGGSLASSAAYVDIAWTDAEEQFDTDAYHTGTTATITIPTTDRYDVNLLAVIAGSGAQDWANSRYRARLLLNGSEFIKDQQSDNGQGDDIPLTASLNSYPFTAGDLLKVQLWQQNGPAGSRGYNVLFSCVRRSTSPVNVAPGIVVANQAEQEAGTEAAKAVTPAVQHFHPSAAKAWCKAGISGAMAASYNMTSVTDGGVGLITFTIANDFSSANWAYALQIENIDASIDASTDVQCSQVGLAGQAAGSLACICGNASGTAAVDPTNWSFIGFGDL